MPFNIWCEGCGNHVGMGVRYNAEKKKVGMYYTTPIYEFHMKCHLCDNYFDIRTDPKNFDYELVSGCHRQERRWEPGEHGGHTHTSKEAARKLATDPMYKLEHGAQDRANQRGAQPQLTRLEALQQRLRDDFAANQALRKAHRTERQRADAQKGVDDLLRSKGSLGDLPLLAETDEDRRLASLLSRYSAVKTVDEKQTDLRRRIRNRSIFQKTGKSKKSRSSSISETPACSFATMKSSSNMSAKFKNSGGSLRALLAMSAYRKRKMQLSTASSNFPAVKIMRESGCDAVRTEPEALTTDNVLYTNDEKVESVKHKPGVKSDTEMATKQLVEPHGLQSLSSSYASDSSDNSDVTLIP